MPKVKKQEPKKVKAPKYYFAVGRRKRSVARVKLFAGKGTLVINGQPVEKYFSGEAAKAGYNLPFILAEPLGNYFATAKINGGGKSSQLGAFVHGVARAMKKADEKLYPSMKKFKLLTRDPREKERRKPGNAQKARAKKQSPKR